MATVLPSIIYDTQMAYVPGRDISFNNRILSYITENMSHMENKIVSFDAEKAFDSVSHEYLLNTLMMYGFPESFITFFNLIYRNNTAVVQVNGHLSSAFDIKRGVKQGDALSCSLFILAMDPLIRNIEANRNIIPLTLGNGINQISVKTLAYADDIAVVTNDVNSIKETFKEYERLYWASGLKLNADKTEILDLAVNRDPDEVIRISYLNEDVCLNYSNCIKICGNHLLTDKSERYKLNVTARIDALSRILASWSRPNLTLNGKMMIIKCHALSQLMFVNQFHTISNIDVKKIESICYKFLWKGGPEHVKRCTLKLRKQEGGIDGIDVESFLNSIKIRQFFKADVHNRPCEFIQKNCIDDTFTLAVRNSLVKLLKSCWKGIDYRDLSDSDQRILMNCDLRYFVKPHCKSDIILKNMVNLSINGVLQHGRGTVNKVVRSLPAVFKSLLRLDIPYDNIVSDVPIHWKTKTVLVNRMTSRNLQDALKIAFKKVMAYSVNDKYDRLCESAHIQSQSWFYLWKIRNPILRNYRLKVMYKDVYCQERRHRFKLSDSPMCLCCGEIETVQHQLYDCPNARRLWRVYNEIFNTTIPFKNVILSEADVVGELIKAVIIGFLAQINRSSLVSINNLMIRMRQVLSLELHVTKNRRIEQIIEKIDAMLA